MNLTGIVVAFNMNKELESNDGYSESLYNVASMKNWQRDFFTN